MMKTGGMGGFCDVHVVVDDVTDDLQDDIDDPAASGTTRGHDGAVVAEEESGSHGTEHSLVRFNCIVQTANQAVGVGRARFGGEVVHLVVEEDSRPGNHYPGAITEIQGVGVGYRVAIAINHAEVGGFVALRPGQGPQSRRDLCAGRGAVVIDPPCQAVGVVPGHQLIYRDLDEIGIPQIARPVGISPAHGFGGDMNGVGGVVAVIADGKVLEDVEHLDEVRSSGTRGRHGHYFPVAVAAHDREAFNGTVGGEVVAGDQSPLGLHVADDGSCQFPQVKCVRTVFGQESQAPGEILLNEPAAYRPGLACRGQKDFPGGLVFLEVPGISVDGLVKVFADQEPVLGKFEGRLQSATEGDCPVSFQGEGKSTDCAGDAR